MVTDAISEEWESKHKRYMQRVTNKKRRAAKGKGRGKGKGRDTTPRNDSEGDVIMDEPSSSASSSSPPRRNRRATRKSKKTLK